LGIFIKNDLNISYEVLLFYHREQFVCDYCFVFSLDLHKVCFYVKASKMSTMIGNVGLCLRHLVDFESIDIVSLNELKLKLFSTFNRREKFN